MCIYFARRGVAISFEWVPCRVEAMAACPYMLAGHVVCLFPDLDPYNFTKPG